MKFKSIVSNIITNKYVLNIVFVLSILNILGYLILGNINAAIYFVLIGVLIRFFSKNMIIILGSALIISNLIVLKNSREGFDASGNTIDVSGNSIDLSGNQTVQTIKTNLENNTNVQAAKANVQAAKTNEVTPPPSPPVSESFEPKSNNKKAGKYNIDYASTVEDAYGELNKIIGGDGIKNLTSDTQNLMKQQVQLAEAMKGMGPLIQGMAPLMKQAQGMLGSMGGEGGLGSIAKTFSAGK